MCQHSVLWDSKELKCLISQTKWDEGKNLRIMVITDLFFLNIGKCKIVRLEVVPKRSANYKELQRHCKIIIILGGVEQDVP